MFKLITEWVRRRHKCAACGTKTAMKHELHGKTYCNRCVILASLREDYSRREKERESLRQVITQQERDFCEVQIDDYSGLLYVKYHDNRIPEDRYERCTRKLDEWESWLETLDISEVSGHR